MKDFKLTAVFGEPKTPKVKDADDKIAEMKKVNEAGFVKRTVTYCVIFGTLSQECSHQCSSVASF